MIDDGLEINVCPFKVLEKLNITKEDLTKFDMVIKAYDESKRVVEGTFKTVVKTGPIETVVKFIVLDILITFGLLLGWLWFHPLGGVPSTLHQKIEFPYKGSVITIEAKFEDGYSVVYSDIGPPGFQVASIFDDYMDSKVAMMLKKSKFVPGMSLGKNQQGIAQFPNFKNQMHTYRLGYLPEQAQKASS